MSWFSKAVEKIVGEKTKEKIKDAGIISSVLTGTVNPAAYATMANDIKQRKADGKSNRLYDIALEKSGSRTGAAVVDPYGAYDKKQSKKQADKLLADKDSTDAKKAMEEERKLMRLRVGQSSLIATQDPATGAMINTAIPFMKKRAGKYYYGG